MHSHRLLDLLAAVAFTLALISLTRSESRRPVLRKPSSLKTGCYIIAIKEKATEKDVQELLTKVIKASDDHKMYGLVQKATRAFTVKLSPYTLEMVRGMAAVDYIEEEGFASGDAVDGILQWHLDRIDQAGYPLDLSYAPIGNGEGVDIFILDSGINFDHEEFEYRAKYVGYDPVDEYSLANDVQEDYQRLYGRDCHGHGTHVASLSTGKTYGTAKKATVYSVRVLACNNAAPWSIILDGLDYVSQVVTRTKRPSVVSMSLSGDFYRSVNDAVANLVKQGVHVVVAAGNGGLDACSRTPASSSSVITVGGSKNGDGLYLLGSGSNFGSCVDIFAPGERILAADWMCYNCCKTLSGTSMSAPIVSGVVAIHLSRQPLITPDEMKKKLIRESLKNVLSFDGITNLYRDNTPNNLVQVPGSCGGTYFFRSFTYLSSPNYPQPYPPNLDCVWHIKVASGLQVVAKITFVNLETKYDILRLYEGECCNRTYQVAEFTGNLGSLNYSYTSAKGELSLQLVTDGTGSTTGFTGSFTKVYAGTDIKVPDPDIELPSVSPVRLPSHVITLRSLAPKPTRNRVRDLLEKGYKVTWITTHFGGAAQKHAFDVILTNNTQVDTRVFIDLSSSQLNTTIQQMSNEGYSIHTLADRERGVAPNSRISYTALFKRRDDLLDTYVFHGDSVETYVQRVSQMNSTGHRLISQSFVQYQGRIYTSTIFTKDRRLAHNITFDPPPKIAVFHNATFFDFTRLTLSYARKNYYLSSVEVHSQTGFLSARLSAIMVAHTDKTIALGNWFRWGLDETAVDALIKSETANWDPYIISGYSHQGVIRYFIEFVRHVP